MRMISFNLCTPFSASRIPKDDAVDDDHQMNDNNIKDLDNDKNVKITEQSGVSVQQINQLETTTPLTAAASTSSTTTTTVSSTFTEQDSREETTEEINKDINENGVSNNNYSNNRIKVQTSSSRFKPVGRKRGGGFRSRFTKEKSKERPAPKFISSRNQVTEKQPDDFSQTASNLFLSTFMGVQRTEAPIISSTTSKMFIVTMAQESSKSQHSNKGQMSTIQYSSHALLLTYHFYTNYYAFDLQSTNDFFFTFHLNCFVSFHK